MRHHLIALGLTLFLLVPSVASAQYTTMDRMDAGKWVDLEFDLVFPDSIDTQVLRTELYGQAAFDTGGGYLMLPFSTSFPEQGEGTTAMGNLELGGFLLADFSLVSLVGRFGLVIPTAPEDFNSMVVSALGIAGHINQVASISPHHTTLRFSVSPSLDFGLGFARADLGLDFAIPTGDHGESLTMLRANAAAGVALLPVNLAVELATVGDLSSGDGDVTDRFLHTAALTLSLSLPIVHPYLAFVTPLDDPLLGEFYVFVLGVRAGLFD